MQQQARKAWIVAVLGLVLVFMAACSSKGNEAATPSQGSSSAAPPGSAQSPAAAEETGYPASFKYWVQLPYNADPSVTNYSQMKAFQHKQEITGTQVEFLHPSGEGAQVAEQLNLLLASRNLPDVIESNWRNIPKGPDNAIKDGAIIRLNELIDQQAPNFKKYLDDNPDIRKMITTGEGNIYAFPFIRGDQALRVSWGPIMRADWLKTVGLEPPETIDEWETALIAFRDHDLNGNGKQDEIPFVLPIGAVNNSQLNPMIGAWGITGDFYQVDGTVKFGPMQDEYKQFLTVMKRWYDEKLIDPDFAAVDNKLLDAKVTNNQLGAFFHSGGGGLGRYLNLMKDAGDTAFDLIGLRNPTLNKGDMPALGMMDFAYQGLGSAAITTSAKNPEQIVKWLDYNYSEEGQLLFNFGIEGESYTYVDGVPKLSQNILDNNPHISKYALIYASGPFVQDVRAMTYTSPNHKQAVENWAHAANKVRIPPITMSADDSAKLNSVMSDINTYIQEMNIKFIMGVESLDKFDAYVNQLKSMGIEDAVKIQQNALDSYNQAK